MKFCLLLCCHSNYSIVPPGFAPVQCGAALNSTIDGAVPDNAGCNISEKNREYCELTAHYFAWKNIDADWYGFCHYRRFFAFSDDIKKPYIVRDKLSDKELTLLGNEERLNKLLNEFDMIVPRAENMGLSAREHYCTSAFHFKIDLDLFLGILYEKYPFLLETAEKYLSQNRQYFCNMFIMCKSDFNDYCRILFGVLEEFDRLKKPHGNYQSDRTDGYLGEIFTGIYISYMREHGRRIKELPRIDCGCTRKKLIMYSLLPPESKARFAAKQFLKSIKR